MAFQSSSQPLVVVFGGAGYLGACLVRLLLDEGYRVRIFDNFLFGYDGIAGLSSANLDVREGDICDTRTVSSAVLGAESVILLSAIVGRRVENIQGADMRDVNFLASTVVLDAAQEHGASRFIFASTDSVYGVQSGVMFETGTPEPQSLYSRLKLRMEGRVMAAKGRDFHPTSLRVATCYGVSPRMRFDLVVNSLVRDAVCKRKIEIVSGESCRALVHVFDAARAFVSCLKAHVNLVSGEIFNVGSQDAKLSLGQLANIVASHVPETEVSIRNERPDLVNYHLSSSKIQKILDYRPNYTLSEAILELRDKLERGDYRDPYDLKYSNT